MYHRLLPIAAGLAALAAGLTGTASDAFSSESAFARLPVIGARQASATSSTLVPAETDDRTQEAGNVTPRWLAEAGLLDSGQQEAGIPSHYESIYHSRDGAFQTQPSESRQQPEPQQFEGSQPTVQQASTTDDSWQATRIVDVQPERATIRSEPSAYSHLMALQSNQYNASVSTGEIERPSTSRAQHTAQIRPIFIADDGAPSSGEAAVNEPELVPPSDRYSEPVYEVACGPGCNAHNHGGWLWTFGVEETFLVPDRDGTQATVTAMTPAVSFASTPKESMEFGPRLWFGIQKPHWQVLARLWLLNGVDNDYDPVLLGTGDNLGSIIDNDVQAFTVDIEAQRLFIGADGWNHYIGFGYRFASLEDVSRVSVTALDPTNPIAAVTQADAFAYSQIDGSGMTVSFGATKPIHCGCCSQLDFYYNLRGSLIWGEVDNAVQTSVVIVDPNIPGAANRFDAASATGSDEMFIAEFQVGVRWTHQLKCMPGIAFFQTAFEYQWWDADGGIAFSESAALLNASSGSATAVSGPNTEIGLVGFTAGAGMVW